MEEPKLFLIDPRLLDPPRDDLRQERSLEDLQRLAADLRERGMMHPIRARPAAGGRHEVLTGESRRQASLMAGMTAVPVIIVEGELSESDLLLDRILENSMRSDTNPMDEARGYQELIRLNGWTQAELAQRLHKSTAEVSKLLTVSRNLLPELQELVEDGKLPITAAAQIARIDDPQQQRDLAKLVVDGVLTRDAVAVRVSRLNGKKPRPKARTFKGKTPGGVSFILPDMTPEGLVAEIELLLSSIKRMAKLELGYESLAGLMKQ